MEKSCINGAVEILGRILIPLLLVNLIPSLGLWSIWWATCLTWVVSAVFCSLRYLSWKKKVGL